jgi:hypothetical protein
MRQRLILIHSLVCLLILTFCSTCVYAADITVDASLSHRSIPVGKAARLTITVNGTRSADIELPQMKDVRFHNRGQSSQISMVNGSISANISSKYLVQPLNPGQYTIPAIRVTADGKEYTTAAITFRATGTATPNNGDAAKDDEEIVFIRVSTTGNHYPGEIVPVQIKVYFDQQYRADIQSLPTLQGDGVVMAQLQEKPQQIQESLGNKTYNVLIWDTTLSGIKAGKHPITFTLDASLLIPQSRRSSSTFGGSSLFNDSFFNNMFDDYQRKPISVVSPEIIYNVLPLPTANQPENLSFTGAIGDFELKVTASPLDVGVGEPITLTMEVSGQGNFDRVEAPVFPGSSDWKTYDPSSNFTDRGSNYSGAKVFEQAIVAKNDRITKIPALSFSFFDPKKARYITRTSKPISLRMQKTAPLQTSVQPAQSTPAQQQLATLPARPENIKGLAPIHLSAGTFAPTISPLFKKIWFVAICGICVLLLLALLLYRRRLRKFEQHPEIRHQQHQKQLFENDLEKINQAQLTVDSMAFLSGCRVAMQNQLGPLWDMEPTAISLTDLKTHLKPDSGLIEIFAAAEQAVYGAATLSGDTMVNYCTTVTTELEELL